MLKENNSSLFEAYEENEPIDCSRPEKGLLVAVLLTAITDLKKPGDPSRKATEFFLNNDEDYIFSFRSICSHLSVDPHRVLTVAGLLD